ncbi:MAG: long-chain acyl-CoA synthetase [Acidimicrobiaceae bacterium]|nr:long-chain acyl-CoA synthetase [Acidimicrobiaceae bacterium]
MNLAAVIEPHPAEAPALRTAAGVLTYGDLRTQVAGARAALAEHGIGPGGRVALVSENDPAFVIAYLAALGLGAVAVPLNPGSPAAELEREVDAVGATVLVVGRTGREAVAGLAAQRPGLVVLDDLSGRGGEAPLVDRADDDLAVLIFTAGTAGSPKAAMLTHGNLRANLEQVQRHPGREVQSSDVSLGVLPLFHIFGLNVVLGLMLLVGGSVALDERFEPTRTLAMVRDHGVTLVAGAPPMYRAWANLPGAEDDAFAHVRLLTSGAAPLPDEVAHAFTARFGVPIHQGYGLTEASPVVTSSLIEDEPKAGSIGVPLPGVEVRLIDTEGEDALVGDDGEIWVRGANVFSGYWQDEEATAAVLTLDGWLKTGDIAVADESGHLWIVDRAKDLIIVSGFNVYPVEVEEALLAHPGIAEVAVVGVPAAATGEAVKAFVVRAPGADGLTEADVTEFAASCLARYKAPTEVSFVPEVPHGLAGKLLRRQLRSA